MISTKGQHERLKWSARIVDGVVPAHRAARALLIAALAAASCQTPAEVVAPSPTSAATAAAGQPPAAEPPLEPAATEPPTVAREPSSAARPRPAWLGARVLPRRPDGFGHVRPTPPVLRNRRLETVDHLPAPTGDRFRAQVTRVPDEVAARSTWSDDCPVGLGALRYVTVSFWGFDEQPHTGELLVHRAAADDVVRVFRRLYRERFPVEEMRVVRAEELDLPPTGDGNNTTAFVCRPSRGSTTWSQHAHGLAIDVNPFHNPYVKGDLVLPELASAYTARERRRPGMVLPDGPVVDAFARIGWGWGGDWSSSKDWMHFSANGR